MSSQPIERVTTPQILDDGVRRDLAPVTDVYWHSEEPRDLAQMINVEFGNDNLDRLAEAATKAAIANMQPSSKYADVLARGLAADAVRYALGLKELPQNKE